MCWRSRMCNVDRRTLYRNKTVFQKLSTVIRQKKKKKEIKNFIGSCSCDIQLELYSRGVDFRCTSVVSVVDKDRAPTVTTKDGMKDSGTAYGGLLCFIGYGSSAAATSIFGRKRIGGPKALILSCSAFVMFPTFFHVVRARRPIQVRLLIAVNLQINNKYRKLVRLQILGR